MFITCDYIVCMDAERKIIKDGAILIEDGKITEVGSRKELDKVKGKGEETLDGKGKVAMPGLINMHTHLSMTLFRGFADDLPLDIWLKERIWPLEAKLTGYDCYVGALLGCLEMLKTGTTCFVDMYFFMEDVAKAVKEAGIKAFLSYGMIDLFSSQKREIELKKTRKFVNFVKKLGDEKIKPLLGPHAPYTCSKDMLLEVREFANEEDLKITIHCSETKKEVEEVKRKFGKRPIEYLNSIGFLGKDVLLAHCVWLSPLEVFTLAKSGASVVYNPISNMKLASGICPVHVLLKNNVNVTIGTDGCASNNNLDMFEEMKVASLLPKINTYKPDVVNAYQILEMATVNAAKFLEINSGSIEVGKAADIILLDLNKPFMNPIHNIVSNIVYAANGSCVDTVIIDGKIVVQNKKVLTLDEEEVIRKAREAAYDLVNR